MPRAPCAAAPRVPRVAWCPQANPEVSEASAFRLQHYRPGTVSLALGENDEEPTLRQRPDYRPLEFLITTGAPLDPYGPTRVGL
jgi:hypothetical protein